uniref:DNA-directed RNA polymerase subunit Rpo11 n=1 Tax=uncultured marine thaumarchaeote KM3_49_A08 TaxID=1456171 RepID=A0A075H7R3_9ARCH|nr:DNA-directed RNA polymerase subunit L (rpoL) [uncultured marine thaumarchaeote KM3_49_A08]
MNVQLIESKSDEVSVSIKEGDIATLYIIQHELLKDKTTDFAGIINKHPLTNEIWMRVNSKSNPLGQILSATDSAIKTSNELKKLISSKLK